MHESRVIENHVGLENNMMYKFAFTEVEQWHAIDTVNKTLRK